MKKVKDARLQVLKLAMKHTMKALHNAESEKEKAELNEVVDFILDEQEPYVRKTDKRQSK